MRTRRELLTMSGAGVAALALPSLLPARGAALAQDRRADPMLVEIGAQFQRALAQLSAVPPRGNAQQLASLYRMLAAWGRVNNVDAQIRRAVEQAIALEGHHAFVTKLGSFDWLGDARARGYNPPFRLQNPTAVDFAKAVGLMRAGFRIEDHWRRFAGRIERNADRFNRQMAIRNGVNPDANARIRLIQDGDIDGDGVPDSIDSTDDRESFTVTGDCVQNPDGTFTCNLALSTVDPQICSNINLVQAVDAFAWGFLCLIIPEFCGLMLLVVFLEEMWAQYVGC